MSAVIELAARRAESAAPAADLPEWVRDLIESLPPVMAPRTLSDAIEVSVPTLTRWRKTWPNGERLGPAFSTPPGTNMVRYSRLDVARWFAASHVSEVTR